MESYLFIINLFVELKKKNFVKKTDFTFDLIEINEQLSKDDIKGEDIKRAKDLLLKKYKIDASIKNKTENIKDIFNIFILKANKKSKEIEFCVGKTDMDIKNLIAFLQDRESGSGNLQPEDFDDFIGCKKYVNEIIERQVSNDRELFNLLKQNFKLDKYYIIKFNNYIEKYGEIKELYEDSLSDHSEITKTLINKLM